MEDGSLSSLALLITLIALHAVLQIGSAVFSNFRRTPMRDRADEGETHARSIMRIADDLPRMRLTLNLALTFVRFAIVVVAFAQIAWPLAVGASETLPPFSAPDVRQAAIVVVVLFVVAFFTYAFGEVAAGAIGQVYADQLIGLASPLLGILRTALSPLILLVVALDRAIGSWTGSEALDKAVTEEEIMTLVDESQQSGAIEDTEKEMIYSVLQFGETLVREVMVPRPDITAVPIRATIREVIHQFMESGHSRIPVYEDEIDNVRGLLYAKDILRLMLDPGGMGQQISELLRPAYFVPETKRADALFEEMQRRKTHIAVVVDEYGGTAGIVTIEDLIEEIVGDIKDEYDSSEEDEYTRISPDAWLVDGGMSLDDINDLLDIHLPTDETDSIGGFIYSRLGRVPEVGDALDEPNLLIRVDAIDNRRIRKVYIARLAAPSSEEDNTRERSRDKSEKPAAHDSVEPA